MKRFLLAVVLCFGMGVHVPVHGGVMKDVCDKIMQVGTFVKNFGNVATVGVRLVIVSAVVVAVKLAWDKKKLSDEKVENERPKFMKLTDEDLTELGSIIKTL